MRDLDGKLYISLQGLSSSIEVLQIYNFVLVTAAFVQESRPLVVVCTRVYPFVHITTALVQRCTLPAMIRTRIYTFVYVTAAIVHGRTTSFYQNQNFLTKIKILIWYQNQRGCVLALRKVPKWRSLLQKTSP